MVSRFYPMLCVESVAETVNFYEDYFDFVPVYEEEHFVKMQLKNNESVFMTIVDSSHPDLPENYRQATKNVILNFPVEDIEGKYDALYMEGLAVHSRPTIDSCGYPHFFVSDPSGNLIDVMQAGMCSDRCFRGTAANSDAADDIVFA